MIIKIIVVIKVITTITVITTRAAIRAGFLSADGDYS